MADPVSPLAAQPKPPRLTRLILRLPPDRGLRLLLPTCTRPQMSIRCGGPGST